MSTITRRTALGTIASISATGAVKGAFAETDSKLPASPENPPVSPAMPITTWANLIASLGEIAPDGARVGILGGRHGCRAEIYETFMEPVHPKLPGRMMPVEWITGSYRLTEDGWESEGIYEGRSR